MMFPNQPWMAYALQGHRLTDTYENRRTGHPGRLVHPNGLRNEQSAAPMGHVSLTSFGHRVGVPPSQPTLYFRLRNQIVFDSQRYHPF